MNFEHSVERRMLADVLDRYIRHDYSFDTRKEIQLSKERFSRKVWEQLCELGVLSVLFSEEDGGFGGSAFDISVVFESLGRGLVLEPVMGSALLAGTVLLAAGDAEHVSLANDVTSGGAIAALAHGEPESGYNTRYVSTGARREGGNWILNGCKANVSQGQVASTFLVSARTSGRFDDEAGISLFVVPAGAHGITTQELSTFDGGKIIELTLDEVCLPASALVGPEGGAFSAIELALNKGTLALCAEAVGAMDVALNSTLEYLKTRKQFGVPIGSFQALQHRMATLAIEIEQARSAVINASAALDGKDRGAAELALSAAKYLIGKVGTMVAEECIQLHGGIGMTDELPLSHYAKRLLAIDHELGDATFHLDRFITLGRTQ